MSPSGRTIRSNILLGLVWGAALTAGPAAPEAARAVLGEEQIAAQSRAGPWEERFSVCCPVISADTRGISVRECWSVTGLGVTPDIAIDFARILLPESIRDRPLGQPQKDGNLWLYPATNGYRVVLRELDSTTSDEAVIEIEVQSPHWSGGRC